MYIYIHIPFCSSICSYCDFPKVLYCQKYVNLYLDNLEAEILKRYKGEVVKSIYIGGGTPSSLNTLELKKLLAIIKIFHCEEKIEFTVEANVESLDEEKIKILADNGVNRVSLGVQSFDSANLVELNRHHSKREVFRVVEVLRRYGIDNISVDIIYGVSDDLRVLEADVDAVLALNIPHVSFYSLIIEDNTLFGIRGREYISEEVEYLMYSSIEERMLALGYNHYEVSNYSRVGYESVHNINYWRNGFYYGFGLGAVSFVENKRINNTKNLSKYLRGLYQEEEVNEDFERQVSNALILGLRMVQGIDVLDFKKRYGVDIRDLYNIRELISDEKLVYDGKNLFIAKKYYYLSNEILINFV